jgi:hypothetical protein
MANYHQAKANLDAWKTRWDDCLSHQIDGMEAACLLFVDFLHAKNEDRQEAESFGAVLFKTAFLLALTLVPEAAFLSATWEGIVLGLSEKPKKWAKLGVKAGYEFVAELHKEMDNVSGEKDKLVNSGSATLDGFIHECLNAIYSKEETIHGIYTTTDHFIAGLIDRGVMVADYVAIVDDVISDFKVPRTGVSDTLYKAMLYTLIQQWMSRHQVTVRMQAWRHSDGTLFGQRPAYDDSDTPDNEAVSGLNGAQLEIIFSNFGSNSVLQQYARRRHLHDIARATKCTVSKVNKLRKKGKWGLIPLMPEHCLRKHVLLAGVKPIDEVEDLRHLGAAIITTSFRSGR